MMTTEQYFSEFIAFMNTQEELFKELGPIALYYGGSHKYNDSNIYNSAKAYLKELYIKEQNSCADRIHNNEHQDFDEIWAEMHRITFNYCNHFNTTEKDANICRIQRYMANCFVREECSKHGIERGAVGEYYITFYLSPSNSKFTNWLALKEWEVLYDAMPSIIRAIKSIEQTFKLTGHDFYFHQ